MWDLLGSQMVANIIAGIQSDHAQDIAEAIVREAAIMWRVEEGNYRDDITVIVLRLPWLP